MSDNRPARYIETTDDGTETVVYRASSLGGCERAFVAMANGYAARPHPQWFQEVLDEGTAMESVIREMFHVNQGEDPTDRTGWQDQFEGELEVGTIGGRRIVVRWHCDDVLFDDDDPKSTVLREYKKFRDSTWPKFQRSGVECNPNYPWQVAAMMHTLDDMGYAVACQFIGGHYQDEDEGNGRVITEVQHHVYADPPIPRVAILKKLARIERLIAEGNAPDETPCQVSFPCGFWYLHDDQLDGGKNVAADVTLTDEPALRALKRWSWCADQVKHYQGKLKEFEAEKRKATEALGEFVDAGATARGEVDGESVVVKHHRQDVAERTQTMKAHTRDYFQVVKQKGDPTDG